MELKQKQKLIKKQFELEKNYAQQILKSEKNSLARKNLIARAYCDVTNIIYQYNPHQAYSRFNEFTTALVKKNLPIKKNVRVLDFGCGDGELVLSLNKNNVDAYGFDVSENSIREAQKKLAVINKEKNVFHGDFNQIQENFDLIIMDNVIEHLVPDELPAIISKCHELLNNQGILLIITPHPFSGPHDISNEFLPLGAKAQGLHLKEYKLEELKDVLEQNNFSALYGYGMHPRILNKLNVIFKASTFGLKKSLWLENFFGKNLRFIFNINRNLSRLLNALLFPNIIIAKKHENLTNK
ncbi:MAG: class I SAM-dependent methyltransferase [Patescibacteria group bacterium]